MKNAKKKPKKFVRTDAHKKKRLGLKWRKPKGLHNKRRLLYRGYAKVVKQGYQSDRDTKGFVKGLKPILVFDISALEGIDKKKEGIIVSGKIGSKRRLEILELAKKDNITILNLNADKKIKLIKDAFVERKKTKEEKKAEKDKKEKEAKKEEENIEEKTEEEKKIEEKKKKDKLLIKKQ